MSMRKSLNLVLFSISMVHATSYAADAGNLYTSSAIAKLKWDIQQQNLEYGNGVILHVPPLAFEVQVPISETQNNITQKVTCFDMNGASQYHLHLDSLPRIFNDFTGNKFATWRSVQSDISLTFEPIKDNSVSTNLSSACVEGVFDNRTYVVDHATMTKNGQPFINAQNIAVKRSFEVVGDKVNVNIDASIQHADVIEINRYLDSAKLSIKIENLDREATNLLYSPNRDGMLAVSIEQIPALITDNSKVSWTFDMDTETGHTKQRGNLDLTKLLDSTINLSNIGDATLKVLYGSSSIQDTLSAMLPRTEDLNGEVITQTTQGFIDDVVKLGLKSISSYQLENQTFSLSRATPRNVESLTRSLKEVMDNEAPVAYDQNIVTFSYKFQDGKLLAEGFKQK